MRTAVLGLAKPNSGTNVVDGFTNGQPTEADNLDKIDAAIGALQGGGAATPGAPDQSIQFNDSGTLGGDADLTWDKISKSFNANGVVTSQHGMISGATQSNEVIVGPADVLVESLETGATMEIAADQALSIWSQSGSVKVQNGGGTNLIEATHDGKLAFFAAAPIVKPSVTGSRGGNAALASLLTQLANLGLLTDSTTA